MQVKGIAAPAEARSSVFGSRFFLADSRDVASFTHDVDNRDRSMVEASTWVAVPFGRDVLVATAMASRGTDWSELAAMSADEFREWLIGEFLYMGAHEVKTEMQTNRFCSGYAHDAEQATFFGLVSAQVDAAFGFDIAPHYSRRDDARTLALA